MNMLGNQNHFFFFWMGEKKCPRMFIVHTWNIFSAFFFYSEKKNHACLKTYMGFLIKFVKLVNHHTSPMNILGFFPIPKLNLKALYELFQ